jgi:hypothetical protein
LMLINMRTPRGSRLHAYAHLCTRLQGGLQYAIIAIRSSSSHAKGEHSLVLLT